MKFLNQLCVPRPSVFDPQRRDTVLDLSDLVADRVKPDEFFAENYITEGMKTLLTQGFRRLEGTSDQGVFMLKQAMGGGKTHNLLTLGLLAKHPEYRQKLMSRFHNVDPALGPVKVVAFTGRDSDEPLGIWGAIADQLGKTDHFKDCYSPLQAPGQNAWVNLLAGETVLILLDELPPYFENARSRAIGNSDLARVTATALSNLLVAINKEPCARVCLVITDLSASYQGGSQQIAQVLADFEKETHRTAMSLEPVRINSDELYYILQTRLFTTLPASNEVAEVAQAYARAIRDAKQMDITNESPEQFATRIQSSYPFHPALRDLYARFRENPGFQQTRGLIRLMRIVTARLWHSGLAEQRALIAAHDLDLNDRETLSEITQINNTLENAIAHDIASNGGAVAEVMDANLGTNDTQDATRLLLMASLANVPNAVLGLTIPELIANLAAPGRDLTRLKGEVLEKLATVAWYLHSNRDGKLYFKNVQNLNAKLESLVKAYDPEQALRELRKRLEELFAPTNGWCYQRIAALPPLDEIALEQDRVTLVITEPHTGVGLRPELKQFYEQATWKNRVGFLTGNKNTYDQLIDTGKRLKAIQQIVKDLQADNTLDSDPQMIQARDLDERIQQNFYSAVRETFTTLWYPLESGLVSADLRMRFEGNKYNGEQQVIDVLREKQKFTDDVGSDTFRRKCEQRLFTTQVLPWSEIKKRAAINTKWQWHRADALDRLKDDCLFKDIWRENGGFVDKGPFPPPRTGVQIDQLPRIAESDKVRLRVQALRGDTIYWEVGGPATTASARLDGNTLETDEVVVSFLAVDSTEQHAPGEPVTWKNTISVRHRVFGSGNEKRLELQAIPRATIYYTTDGSNPKVTGASYDGPFTIPRGATVVQAYAERDGVESAVERITINWDKGSDDLVIDSHKPAIWRQRHDLKETKDSYEFLKRLRDHEAQLSGVTITISGEGSDREWLELTMFEGKRVGPDLLETCLETLRKLQTTGQVQLQAEALHFAKGQDLTAWVEGTRTTLQPGSVKQ